MNIRKQYFKIMLGRFGFEDPAFSNHDIQYIPDVEKPKIVIKKRKARFLQVYEIEQTIFYFIRSKFFFKD